MPKISIEKKDAIWSYLGVIFRFGVNIIVLPLVLKLLPDDKLGIWYVFISIGGLVDLLNFGFSPAIARNVSYVWVGASELKKEGVITMRENLFSPQKLLTVLKTCKYIYGIIATLAISLLLTFGLAYIRRIAGDDVILPWVVFSISTFVNLLYSYYSTFLRGVGAIAEASKADVFSRGCQVILTPVLLLLGYDLLAMSISSLVCGIILRQYSKWSFYRYENIGELLKKSKVVVGLSECVTMFKILWYNSFKEGLIVLSKYLSTQVNTLLCSTFLTLSVTGSYGIAVQLSTIIATVSQIPFTINHPRLQEASIKGDIEQSRRLFSQSIVLYIISFGILTVMIYLFMPVLLYLKPNFNIDNSMLISILLYSFFYYGYSLFASFISCYNELPYTNSFLISAMFSVFLTFVIMKFFNASIWVLILVPLIVNIVYNAWKWPSYALSRYLEFSLLEFVKLGNREVLSLINITRKK